MPVPQFLSVFFKATKKRNVNKELKLVPEDYSQHLICFASPTIMGHPAPKKKMTSVKKKRLRRKMKRLAQK